MELHPIYVAPVNRATELDPIIRHRRHVRAIVAIEEVRMQEIESRLRLQAFEKSALRSRPRVIPAHVRQPRALLQSSGIEFPNPPFDPAKPRQASLLTRLRQHLHTHADSQHGYLT